MVKPRDDALFEQAFFIVRSGASVTEKDLLRQAGVEAEEKKARSHKAGQFLAFLFGAAATGLLWFLFSIL